MSATTTLPSLCDQMLGRPYARPEHAPDLLPASIERKYCTYHEREEIGLRVSENVLKALIRAKRLSAWRSKFREVAVLVLVGELLAGGALVLASAALAAVK